jgi:hypothetical protein
MTRIKTIQTRNCYYPIYEFFRERDTINGFYFFDEELEEIGERQGEFGQGYFGPYKTLDDVCKAQHKHYVSIMSL